MGCIDFAMKNLGIKAAIKFACDIHPTAKRLDLQNHSPEIWYDNVMHRDHGNAPYVDIYSGGFSCQPFSSAGQKHGIEDGAGHGDTRQMRCCPRCFVRDWFGSVIEFETSCGM